MIQIPKRGVLRRRSVLRGLAAGTALTPFIPVLDGDAAQDAPKRLILLNGVNGTIYDNWLPTGSETDFNLGPILAPLEEHKDRIIVLGGMRVGSEGPGQGHGLGYAAQWNGSRLLDDPLFTGMGGPSGWSGGTSVDQTLAQAFGDETPFPSLEFGVQHGGGRGMISAGPNQPIQPEDNPYAMFDRLFSEFLLSPEELAQVRTERQSVIDIVKEDLASLDAKLGAAERYKTEAHLEGIREIEQRLSLDGGMPAGCDVPDLGDELSIFEIVQQNDMVPIISRLQIDLMVKALACDLTRFASLQWSRGLSPWRFTWLGISDDHHELSHAPDSDSVARAALTDINAWYAGEVAYLLDALAATPEGDGTMLDNTLVGWSNALAKGNSHTSYPVPYVLAGSAGGYFETGRFLDYGDESANRLLVSVCNAMGLPEVTTYGDMDPGSGPLEGLA